MSATNSLKNLLKINNSLETLQRFLVPLFLISCLAAVSISQVFGVMSYDQDITKLIAVLNGIYVSMISLKLYSESHQWQNRKYYLWSLILSAIVGGIVYTQGETSSQFFLFGLFFWITLAPFFKNPTLNNDASEVGYCNLNSILLSRALFTNIVLAFILCICIGSVLFSIGYLFDIKISYKIYLSIAIFYFIVCAPFYILSTIPKDFTSTEQNQLSGSIKFITSYILLPLSLIYLVILYAYMAKIAIAGTMPKNIVGYVILVFGMVGIITHFFTRSLYENAGKAMQFFHRYFYHFFFLPIILLGGAIAIRINQYGITVNRYWVSIIAIYLLISSVYIIVTKAKNLRILVMIVSAILVLASFGPESFGPLGANKIAGESQIKQLEALLIKENILQNGKIVKANQNVPQQSRDRIANIVSYLKKIKQIDRIKIWLPNNNSDIEILADFMTPTLAPIKINMQYSPQNPEQNSNH